MSVSMRLTRVGGKKDPVWRVVVADRRSPRDGRVIDEPPGEVEQEILHRALRVDALDLEQLPDGAGGLRAA